MPLVDTIFNVMTAISTIILSGIALWTIRHKDTKRLHAIIELRVIIDSRNVQVQIVQISLSNRGSDRLCLKSIVPFGIKRKGGRIILLRKSDGSNIDPIKIEPFRHYDCILAEGEEDVNKQVEAIKEYWKKEINNCSWWKRWLSKFKWTKQFDVVFEDGTLVKGKIGKEFYKKVWGSMNT